MKCQAGVLTLSWLEIKEVFRHAKASPTNGQRPDAKPDRQGYLCLETVCSDYQLLLRAPRPLRATHTHMVFHPLLTRSRQRSGLSQTVEQKPTCSRPTRMYGLGSHSVILVYIYGFGHVTPARNTFCIKKQKHS